jgi:hypothetical protein
MPRPRLTLPRRLTVWGALTISLAVATVLAISTVTTISLAPPSIHKRHMAVSAAAAHVMIDAPSSLIVDQDQIDVLLATYSKRAELYGSMLQTPPLLDMVAQRAGVRADQIMAITRLTQGVQTAMREPDAEQRASQLAESNRPYRLDIEAEPDLAMLHVYAQAPTVPKAQRLADASITSLQAYLAQRADQAGVDPDKRVRLVQLGAARGGVINGKTPIEIAVLTFFGTFGLVLGLLLGAQRARRGWIAAGRGPEDDEVPGPSGAPQLALVPGAQLPARARIAALGDWPRTTRVIPWMIAGFLFIIWLVPFNVIQLTVSLPFDLKLDRILLPAVFLTWLLTLAIGGPASPRMRLTLIHVGIFGFTAIACLGVLTNAHALNHSLEFDLAIKKITLLVSYVMFFVIVASGVRRTEVPNFMRYTLWLAVTCAIGIIWEYRFQYNPFYDISGKLLRGIFEVGVPSGGDIDDIGRHLTRGPTDHPLEAVGMMAMALPIALVGVIHGEDRRKRILYTLAACILLAAAISTYRKSALLAPLSVCLTIAYFRRGDLLRLAPLGVLALGAVHALSPGALGAIVFQLHPSRLGVSTVSDRASDYDAVRPDVWTHLLLGRGYGTYDHNVYRVLDSEVLGRLVDTGVLGLLALFLMLFAIVAAGRVLIRSRHPVWGPPALAIAAAAVAFLVLTFLFDVTSFPHDPYILMAFSGFLAVLVSDTDAESGPASEHQAARRRPTRPLPDPHLPPTARDGARTPVMETLR